MKYLLIALTLSLPGCAGWLEKATPGALPYVSLELCDEVNYVRKGVEINVQAKCRAPLR